MDYSSRITLRPFDLYDIDDFLKWAGDDKVTHYLRWDTTSREEALRYIKDVAIPHPWHQSICIDNRSIGYVSIKAESGSDQHRAHGPRGVCHWVKVLGQGIITEAMRMGIPCVFKKFPFSVKLEDLVEENLGSQSVLEKVGFTREGFLRKYGFNKGGIRDMFVYSFVYR